MVRRCPCCERDLPRTAFGRHTLGPDGLRSWCKECISEHRRKRPRSASGMKRCPHCGQDKPLEDFGKHAGKKHERESWCRECVRSTRKPIVVQEPVSDEDRDRKARWKDRTVRLKERVERVKQGEEDDPLDYVV